MEFLHLSLALSLGLALVCSKRTNISPAVCWEVFTEISASGGFYTYLTLGSLQTSCREEETFPLPQDNLPSYRKRIDVSGWSIWMWKTSLHVLLLCPKGQFQHWPESVGQLHMLNGIWSRTCMRVVPEAFSRCQK